MRQIHFKKTAFSVTNRGISVRTVIMPRAGRLSNHISIPAEPRYFFLFQSIPYRWETQKKISIQWVVRVVSPAVRRQRREADHLPPNDMIW